MRRKSAKNMANIIGADTVAALLGLVETVEGTLANNFQERRYNYVPSNNGVPVPTTFVP